MKLQRMLLSLCREKGLTLTKLANLSAVPKATLHGWTTGRSTFNLDQLKRVASALGEPDPNERTSETTWEDLFSGDVRITVHRIERRT